MAMTESVSFKAYLKRDGQLDEVRRFGIEGGAATNFMYLRGKIEAMFPSLRNDNFQVSWKDQEGDLVQISSDEELVVALTENSQPLNRLYITVSGPNPVLGPIHPHICCDGCNMKSIQGYRYKCLNCRDYDLCARCEAKGIHSEHFMIRVPVPTNLGPHFGRRFSRSPFKSHKEGKGHKHGKEHKFGMGCPMFTEENWATELPINWSTLRNYFTDFGYSADENIPHTSSAGANAQSSNAAGNAQTSNATPNAQTSNATPNAQTSNEPNQEDAHIKYLRTIGESIAAFLDPLGIDVSFDVQQKQGGSVNNESAKPAPAASMMNEQVSMPSTSQDLLTQSIQIPITVASPSNIQSPPASVNQSMETLPTQTHSRRASLEGWTVLNRDSHSRSPSQPMDVDESRGAIPKQNPPAAAATSSPVVVTPVESVSAPAASPATANIYPTLPQSSTQIDPQLRQGIHEALEKMLSMGFDIDFGRLQNLMQSQNGDITKVVDFLLQ